MDIMTAEELRAYSNQHKITNLTKDYVKEFIDTIMWALEVQARNQYNYCYIYIKFEDRLFQSKDKIKYKRDRLLAITTITLENKYKSHIHDLVSYSIELFLANGYKFTYDRHDSTILIKW